VLKDATTAELVHAVIAGETTRTNIKHILAKLGLRDRAQAVVTAYETGLVTPGG
jgi:ATP/maltotriose-dependent transcriptional regulator MalT